MSEDAPVNIAAALQRPFMASQALLRMQSKLHRRAATEGGRRFDDVYNLVADPCFLVTAWERVRENRGAKTAGIDRATVRSIEESAVNEPYESETLPPTGSPRRYHHTTLTNPRPSRRTSRKYLSQLVLRRGVVRTTTTTVSSASWCGSSSRATAAEKTPTVRVGVAVDADSPVRRHTGPPPRRW